MTRLLTILIPIILGTQLVAMVIKKRSIGLIISSIPGVIGIYFLVSYLVQKASCDATSLCEIGMLLVISLMFLILWVISFATVLITHKIRKRQLD